MSAATARESRSSVRDREKRGGNSRDPGLQHDVEANGGHHTHRYSHHHRKAPKGPIKVKPAGESGRRGFHPFKFLKISWKSASYLSRAVNILWPFVPAAIAVKYTLPEQHVLIFCLAYIAMIPCANLIGV